MGWTPGAPDEQGTPDELGRPAADSVGPGTGEPARTTPASKKGVILILAGLVVTGMIAGWDWLRKLPRD